MTNEISFFAPCQPPTKTAQQKRQGRGKGGKPIFFKDEKAQAAVRTFEAIFQPFQPDSPVTGAVSLTVQVTWPWRKCDLSSKAKTEECERIGRRYFTGKPDLDNFVKQVQDVLAALRFIERDEYVAELIVRKYLGEEPGIRVFIRSLEAAK